MAQRLRRSQRLNPGLESHDMAHITQITEPTWFDDVIAPFIIATLLINIAIAVSALLWPTQTLALLKETLNNFRQF